MKLRLTTLLKSFQRNINRPLKAQSLLELALVLPIMILMLLGIAEVSLYMGRYLDLMDLTREAARQASRDDPFALEANLIATPNLITTLTNLSGAQCHSGVASTNDNFFYKTACFFSPPSGSVCTGPGKSTDFCNGYNRYVDFDLRTDDVVITAFTVKNQDVTDVWPQALDGGSKTTAASLAHRYWALSNKTTNLNAATVNAELWRKDCQGNDSGATTPYYTEARVESLIASGFGAPSGKGYVAVEVYYCYDQILGIPIFTNFVPNPMRIHAYTIMPLPNAIPTPVP